MGVGEEWRYLLVGEACNSASDACDEKGEFGVLLSEGDEFVDIGAYGFDAALHGWDGIRLALEADSLTVDGTEAFVGYTGSTSAVVTGEVTAENEDFVRLEMGDEIRSVLHA